MIVFKADLDFLKFKQEIENKVELYQTQVQNIVTDTKNKVDDIVQHLDNLQTLIGEINSKLDETTLDFIRNFGTVNDFREGIYEKLFK